MKLTRAQILAFRRRVGSLDERLPRSRKSLRRAAWAGLTDSMPRAALLSIHARVEATTPDTWEDPAFVQVWGPRFSAYVVAAEDLAVFTLGRLPTGEAKLRRAQDWAAQAREFLGDQRMPYGDVGRGLGVNPNQLRYAAPTGTIVMRWDGARQPVIWTVPPPDMDPLDARKELASRYVHIFGPSTTEEYAKWAGVTAQAGAATFEALREVLTPVRTPIGDAWILTADEELFSEAPQPAAAARFLPSGDAYYLVWGAQRHLLVKDPQRRAALWTSRVWPGALLIDGEIRGTWRRDQHTVSIEAWQRLSPSARDAVEAEAASLPLPGLDRGIVVRWND